MSRNYSHAQVLADLWRRGLIQATPEPSHNSEFSWQRRALFHGPSVPGNNSTWNARSLRRYSLPSSPSVKFNLERGGLYSENTARTATGEEYGLLERSRESVHGDEDLATESGIDLQEAPENPRNPCTETPRRSPSLQTVVHDPQITPTGLAGSERTSSPDRSAQAYSQVPNREEIEDSSDTDFPPTLPADATARQKSRHALEVLLAHAQEMSLTDSSSSSNGSVSNRGSIRSRQSVGQPPLSQRQLSSAGTNSFQNVQAKPKPSLHQERAPGHGIRSIQATSLDDPGPVRQAQSVNKGTTRVLPTEAAANKVTRFAVPERIRANEASRSSESSNEHPFKGGRGVRPRSPSEASISRVIRETRQPQHQDRHEVVQTSGDFLPAQHKIKASRVTDRPFVPQSEPDEVIKLPSVSRGRGGLTTCSEASELYPGSNGHEPVASKSALSNSRIQEDIKTLYLSNNHILSRSQDNLTGSDVTAAPQLITRYERKPLPIPPSSQSLTGSISDSNVRVYQPPPDQPTVNKSDRRNSPGMVRSPASIEASNSFNTTGPIDPALFEDDMKPLTPWQSSDNSPSGYSYQRKGSSGSVRDSLRGVVKKFKPGGKDEPRNSETASLESSSMSFGGGSYSSEIKGGAGIYVSRTFEVADGVRS